MLKSSTNQLNHRKHASSDDLKHELSGRLVQSTSAVYEIGKYFVFVVVIALLLHSLIVTIKIISGPSMLPNYQSGSHVLVDRRDWINPKRSEVVILRYPGDPDNRQYIKRIVAIGGDTYKISGGKVFVNGQPIGEPYLNSSVKSFPDIPERKLAPTEYFALGDNRPVSNDSRFFGPVDRKFIFGRVLSVLYTPKGN